ncbi:hypothetical protein DOY81_012425, partial [Sarcophaga bullata]
QIPEFVNEDIKTECMNEMEEMFSKMSEGQGPPPGGHHRGPPGGHHHGPHGPNHCFMSCVLNKTGILVDGELQEDNLNDYLNEECPDSVWTNTDECNEVREHFRQCKPPHHHGPHEDDVAVEEDYFDEDQVEDDI